MNMKFFRKLPVPQEVKAQFPLTPELAALKAERDRELSDIFTGKSDRFLLIIGPCSADREDSVLEYLSRLAKLSEQVAEKIFIVPRLYTGKPRSAGDGYMGFLHQPDPGAEPDLLKGIVSVREFHLRALRETGFSCADEMLYPENHRYLSDLLAYVAVGARSVEDQQHRLTASGLMIPVGMKNPTGGNLSAMVNAVAAAQLPHRFLYRGWEVESTGNPLSHGILRGYHDLSGNAVPNYDTAHLLEAAEKMVEKGVKNPSLLVDTNHANSDKNCFLQADIAKAVLKSREEHPVLKNFVKGLMIESYLEDGAQPVGGAVFGKSITDPCLGWEKTERLVLELAERL